MNLTCPICDFPLFIYDNKTKTHRCLHCKCVLKKSETPEKYETIVMVSDLGLNRSVVKIRKISGGK